ncbi:MAG: tripartite tricarboxylate transporter substrate binding protein [Burkholderiales bacterium]|nr:tripartite tricarboxylate transporter substrate binding protein [Burkholderiales bacterium]
MNAKLSKLLSLLAAPLLASAAGSTAVSAADAYPTRPIRLIIPFAPGGGADVVGRLIAGKLSERLGKQIIPDNRTGAGGVIGTDTAAKATPDGYTLAFVPASFTMQPWLQKLPYDPVKAFAPIARVGKGSFVLVIIPSVPAQTLKDLIAHVKHHPGKLFFGTAGAGSSAHMFLELFKLMASIDIGVVHFKGGGQQVTDLLGAHSHGTMISLPAVRAHIASGKLRALATTAAQRTVFLPDVPTLAEAGVPGYEAIVWWGVLAPAGTPASILARLDGEIKNVLALDDVKQMFANQGVEPDYQGSAAFVQFIARELANWKRVVEQGKIKLE